MKLVSIVVPCYNEEKVLPLFYAEITKVMSQMQEKYPELDFELLFINDGSKDGTLQEFRKMAKMDHRVRYVSFSRNFGKEAGMYAGLQHAKGDYVVIMDADLQHPPALIPHMIESVNNGHDCCAAYRTSRKGEKKIRSFFSQRFYKFNNKLTDSNMPYGAVDYRIMCRKMVDSIVSMKEVQRFSKGLFCWVGFDTEWIPYENVERTLGTSKWSFKGLTRYAMDGIFSFSVKPLKFLAIMGFIISGIAIVYALYILIKTLTMGIDLPGYASTMIVLLFIGGIIELSIGVLGEYIARIFVEIKKRPIFITKETNIESKKDPDDENIN